MININNVVLVGRLTKDIDLRKTQSNKSVAQFTVAIDRRFKQDGQSEADFISCVAWNGSADFLSKYARKGTIVSVEGRIQVRSYEKNGSKAYVTEVVSDQVGIISNNKPQESSQPKATEEDVYIDDYEETPPSLDFSPDYLPFY